MICGSEIRLFSLMPVVKSSRLAWIGLLDNKQTNCRIFSIIGVLYTWYKICEHGRKNT